LLQVGTWNSQSALIRDVRVVHVAYATSLRSSSGVLNSTGLGNVGLLASMLSLSQALTVFEKVVIHLIIPKSDLPDATDLVNCFMNEFDSSDDSRPTVEVHAERPLPFNPGTNEHKSELSGNTMTFVRWFLPEYLPNVSNVLYIDTDTIVQKDASELFVQDHDVAMRLKRGDDFDPTMKSIEVHYQRDADAWKAWKDVIPEGVRNYSVFNAGVLVANLDIWRTLNITGRLVDMANAFIAHNATLDDQLVLNIVARQSKSVKELPPRFNEEGAGWKPFCDTPSNTAVIMHWSGKIKPWSFLGLQPRGSCNPFDKYLPRKQCIT
jgi:lipopolysaccharide biosynthesis glycosyltransferase